MIAQQSSRFVPLPFIYNQKSFAAYNFFLWQFIKNIDYASLKRDDTIVSNCRRLGGANVRTVL